MNLKLLTRITIALQAGVFYFVSFIHAAVGGEGGGGQGIVIPSLFSGTIIDVLDRIIGFLLAIAVPIATIMVLYGAFQMLTAGGKAEQFMKGNKTIMYAAIGFAIVLIGRGVISLVQQLITGS